MTRNNSSVHYATNVHHYDDALAAMRLHFSEITLQRRFEPDQRMLDRLEVVPGTGLIRSRMRRRVRNLPDVDRLASLGASQLSIPLLGLLGRTAPAELIRWVNHQSAKRVSKELRAPRVFQFVEGLGHVALAAISRPFETSIMERRNLHHEVFEQEIEPFLGFPHQVRLDPLREYLTEEYEQADAIVVYSSVAADSFLARGFDASRLTVAPLAVHGSFAGRQLRKRRAVRNRFLYVGRGDVFKGLDLAAAAVARLGTPNLLQVAGPAPRDVIEWMNRQDHIEYLGVVSRDRLSALYESSTALLAPSVESFGLAVIDAAAHGLPIVCRETTGAAEFLAADQYTMVSGRVLDDWVEALEGLASSPPTTDTGTGTGTIALATPPGLLDGTLSLNAFSSLYGSLR